MKRIQKLTPFLKNLLKKIPFRSFLKSVKEFCIFFSSYTHRQLIRWFIAFEKQKNILVAIFGMKRGRYNRPFLHIAALLVVGIGMMLAPFLADTYPLFAPSPGVEFAASILEQSIQVDANVFQTNISQKPRDKVITYTVEKGDTLSTIAQKFDISIDTIKWANDLIGDSLTVGDTLKILPVTGMVHKVSKGDSVYTIAKKYDANPQAIVDFPFNEFANPETFSLVEGQTLVIPDGIKPEEKPVFRRQVYIAQGPVSISAAGFTWPLRGLITQFAAWYHMALDIAAPIGSPIVAGQNGTVIKALSGTWDGGYGTNIEIANSDGYSTLYAHLSGLNVGVGDEVTAGQTVIGWVGVTGRTTGSHLHFEIRRNGTLVNPLSYLQ